MSKEQVEAGQLPQLRTKAEREQDVAFCVDLWKRGYNYLRIATELNEHNRIKIQEENVIRAAQVPPLPMLTARILSHVTVFNDIKKYTDLWKKDNLGKVEDYIMRDLQRLEQMEEELWAEWLKSKKHKRKVKTKKGTRSNSKGDSTIDDTEQYSEEKTGDVRYLDMIDRVMQRRKALLGYAGLQPPPPAAVSRIDINAIPEEARNQLAAVAQGIPEVEMKDE